jgi:hypothetical protein
MCVTDPALLTVHDMLKLMIFGELRLVEYNAKGHFLHKFDSNQSFLQMLE